jgi:dihydroorotate dehydrogenase electron transfer subunit
MLRMPYTLAENVRIAKNTWRMKLLGDTGKLLRPGQFVQFRVPEFYLRRPLSVCDWDGQSLTLIYKVVGHGTEAMARMQKGETADLLTGLGNGFGVKSLRTYPHRRRRGRSPAVQALQGITFTKGEARRRAGLQRKG